MSYNINKNGYYGEFGGAFIPEMLYPNIEELKLNYVKFMNDPDFKKEFNHLDNTIESPESLIEGVYIKFY
jgi:tryptophan synthase beta subunit